MIRKLCCSTCISWILLPTMASVGVSLKHLLPCSHSINSFQNFLKSNICLLLLFLLCNLLYIHDFLCMIPKFCTKSTVTSKSNHFVLIYALHPVLFHFVSLHDHHHLFHSLHLRSGDQNATIFPSMSQNILQSNSAFPELKLLFPGK